MLTPHELDAIDATSSARWRGARMVSTRGRFQCLKMEKLGRIRDAAGDSSSVSSLGDLRSTDLMPSDCEEARTVIYENCSLLHATVPLQPCVREGSSDAVIRTI